MPVEATMQAWKPLPFEEAVKFWRSKRIVTPAEFKKMTEEAQLRAFAVSGIAKASLLSDIYEALDRAISEGASFGQFKKDIRHIIETKGWTGKRGFRVQTIFRTNIQTAYSVGKYQQLMESKEELPYWQYDAVGDLRTRPSHAALDGKVFRADDPFWDTWYPPNGFNCRCTVRAMSKEEARARGLAPIEDSRAFLDGGFEDEAGRHRQFIPDPGWARNPGKDWFGAVVGPLIAEADRYVVAEDQPYASDIGLASLTDMDLASLPEWPSDLLIHGIEEARSAFTKVAGWTTDALGRPVLIHESLLTYAIRKGPSHYSVVRLLPLVLREPTEVWCVRMKHSRGLKPDVVRERFVKIWRGEETAKGVLLILEMSAGFLVTYNVFRSDLKTLERNRRGRRIYPVTYLPSRHALRGAASQRTRAVEYPAVRWADAHPLHQLFYGLCLENST